MFENVFGTVVQIELLSSIKMGDDNTLFPNKEKLNIHFTDYKKGLTETDVYV